MRSSLFRDSGLVENRWQDKGLSSVRGDRESQGFQKGGEGLKGGNQFGPLMIGERSNGPTNSSLDKVGRRSCRVGNQEGSEFVVYDGRKRSMVGSGDPIAEGLSAMPPLGQCLDNPIDFYGSTDNY
ncbi:hypothetical protein Q3G72_026708 [Acer saccharum]|nr:hypothetical protein Q3G72_026708 [Acer saccharum]